MPPTSEQYAPGVDGDDIPVLDEAKIAREKMLRHLRMGIEGLRLNAKHDLPGLAKRPLQYVFELPSGTEQVTVTTQAEYRALIERLEQQAEQIGGQAA